MGYFFEILYLAGAILMVCGFFGGRWVMAKLLSSPLVGVEDEMAERGP